MGGEREDVIESPITIEGNNQQIRFHESKGQVHFHVDAESLKCAVPVPVWAKAWERLSNPSTTNAEEFTYTDTANKTILFVRVANTVMGIGDNKTGFDLMAEIHIHKFMGSNAVYDQLKKFTRAQ